MPPNCTLKTSQTSVHGSHIELDLSFRFFTSVGIIFHDLQHKTLSMK